MKVEVWSDVVCPWCYIGKRRFEQALARFAHRDRVDVVWKAFELDPSRHSSDTGGGHAERLAVKYGRTVPQAQEMLDSMTAAGAAEGLAFCFDLAHASNTFDAHRVLHLAGEHGVQDAVKERLLQAHFSEGEPVGDHEVLVRLGAEAGLNAAEVRAVLADGRYADDVRAEQSEATALGINGVPFFVIDRRYGISGAQSPDVLLQAMEQAWSQRSSLTLVTGDKGSCEGDAKGACAV